MVATIICLTSCGLSRVAALTIVRKTTETLYRENGEGMAKFKARSMQECYKQYNERQSYAARQWDRLDTSFETREAAIKRKEISSEHEEDSTVKRKRHAGNFDAMTWDKNGLKSEVEGYADGVKVNQSEIARRYKITNQKGEIAKNGGQIAQEWLLSQVVDLHRFKCNTEVERQPRRKKLKGLGGEISIPTPETNDALKEKLKLQIQEGEFTVGELIVPREVTQVEPNIEIIDPRAHFNIF